MELNQTQPQLQNAPSPIDNELNRVGGWNDDFMFNNFALISPEGTNFSLTLDFLAHVLRTYNYIIIIIFLIVFRLTT